MTSDKYQPHRHLAVDDSVMAEMPDWIKILNERLRLIRPYSQTKYQPDYGR